MATRIEQAYQIAESNLLDELIGEYTSSVISQMLAAADSLAIERNHCKANAALDIKEYLKNKAQDIINDGTST